MIYSKWKKLGVGFSTPPFGGTVDPEHLILETTAELRKDPRLFSALLTWLIHYGDLVNVKKLSGIVAKGNKTLLSAISEFAKEKGADPRLAALYRNRKSLGNPEFMFPEICETTVMKNHVKEHADPHFRRWGYYIADTSTMEKALFSRSRVLRENINLAIRAFLGPNARADVFSGLLNHATLTIHQLSEKAGLSYKPVYTEVRNLIKSDLIKARRVGKAIQVSLSRPARDLFLSFSIRL